MTQTQNGITPTTGTAQLLAGAGGFGLPNGQDIGNMINALNQIPDLTLFTVTGAEAIPLVAGTYTITDAAAAALTLAAPTSGTQDGLLLVIQSATAYAHTITATGLFLCGTASVNVATFAAHGGAGLTLMAFQGKWIVQATNAITFS